MTSIAAPRRGIVGQITPRRSDVIALWGGIAFSLAFTALIWWAGERLTSIRLLPDTGVAWYYWRLPEPTFWTRLTAWGFYLAHQVASWGLTWYAQNKVKKYAAGLHRVNVWALATNAFFIFLHLVQTHIWYDGLAQDVSIFSSQGSVIVMLVWILLMENPRRGLLWGKRVSFSQRVTSFAKKYHGYVFSWAAIYTFWYHPMVNTTGHLIGFFYMFLLLLQGSLFLTRIHVNRWWTLIQEFTVLVHGTLVAVQQGSGIWSMFLFGFAGIFILTQMHGLRLPVWAKWAFLAAFAGGIVFVYSGDWMRLNEVIRIPLIEYLAVFVLAGLIWLGIKLADLITRRTVAIPELSDGAATD